jgi:hypothetical protein
MRNTAFLLLFMTLFTTMIILKPLTTYACSCIPSPPVEEELERVTAVFSGSVTSIKEVKSEFEPLKVTFKVDRIWKGISETEVSIYTGRDSAGCGYHFEEGESYLIYASETEGKLTTGLCSLTKELSSADQDITILGEGKIPTNNATNESTLDQPYFQSISWILLSTVIVGGIGYTIYKVVMKKE